MLVLLGSLFIVSLLVALFIVSSFGLFPAVLKCTGVCPTFTPTIVLLGDTLMGLALITVGTILLVYNSKMKRAAGTPLGSTGIQQKEEMA
jgi:hypothetical protein